MGCIINAIGSPSSILGWSVAYPVDIYRKVTLGEWKAEVLVMLHQLGCCGNHREEKWLGQGWRETQTDFRNIFEIVPLPGNKLDIWDKGERGAHSCSQPLVSTTWGMADLNGEDWPGSKFSEAGFVIVWSTSFVFWVLIIQLQYLFLPPLSSKGQREIGLQAQQENVWFRTGPQAGSCAFALVSLEVMVVKTNAGLFS